MTAWRLLAAGAALMAMMGAGSAKAPKDAELDDFLKANLLSTLYHEMAHAIIDLRDLPVLGREEDAADGFANLAMTEAREEAMMLDVIAGWSLADEAAGEEIPPEAMADEHALEGQRLSAAACHLVGSAPDKQADLAQEMEFDEDKISLCAEDHDKRVRSWRQVLGAPKKGAPVTVDYEPGARMADVKRWGVAELVAKYATERLALPKPVELVFEDCDEANAWYDPETVKITVCYAYIDENASMFKAAYR